HSIIFPGLLLALKDNYKLPDMIVSSEYLNFNDQKFSKSKGIGLTILGIVILILLTPAFGMFLFALAKMVFGISIEKTNSSKFDAFLNWNISS
ncbi:MAG: class I tRNA ligase family protein, partial [Mycoplasmataceae bacterium]|nr:class I tRNA ligase family protein [Mycoplasmataceae bacterium]